MVIKKMLPDFHLPQYGIKSQRVAYLLISLVDQFFERNGTNVNIT